MEGRKGNGQVMNKKEFQDHMLDKQKNWESKRLHLGDDFAVFKFNFKYQAEDASKNLMHYMDYYNYVGVWDGEKRLCILNNGEVNDA